MSNNNPALKKLTNKKCRLTATRVALLDIFNHLPHPISASSLLKLLASAGITVNRSTIYRELDFLEKENIIERVFLGKDKRVYELISKPHHHVICLSCGKITKIDQGTEEQKILKKARKQSNCQINKVSFTFFGLCPKCKTKQDN